MWLSQQLSLDRKKAFVSGFAREAYGALIPIDLIKIVRWYMDEVGFICKYNMQSVTSLA